MVTEEDEGPPSALASLGGDVYPHPVKQTNDDVISTRIIAIVQKCEQRGDVPGVTPGSLIAEYWSTYGEDISTTLGGRDLRSFVASIHQLEFHTTADGQVVLRSSREQQQPPPVNVNTEASPQIDSVASFPPANHQVMIYRIAQIAEQGDGHGGKMDIPTVFAKYRERHGEELIIHARALGLEDAILQLTGGLPTSSPATSPQAQSGDANGQISNGIDNNGTVVPINSSMPLNRAPGPISPPIARPTITTALDAQEGTTGSPSAINDSGEQTSAVESSSPGVPWTNGAVGGIDHIMDSSSSSPPPAAVSANTSTTTAAAAESEASPSSATSSLGLKDLVTARVIDIVSREQGSSGKGLLLSALCAEYGRLYKAKLADHAIKLGERNAKSLILTLPSLHMMSWVNSKDVVSLAKGVKVPAYSRANLNPGSSASASAASPKRAITSSSPKAGGAEAPAASASASAPSPTSAAAWGAAIRRVALLVHRLVSARAGEGQDQSDSEAAAGSNSTVTRGTTMALTFVGKAYVVEHGEKLTVCAARVGARNAKALVEAVNGLSVNDAAKVVISKQFLARKPSKTVALSPPPGPSAKAGPRATVAAAAAAAAPSSASESGAAASSASPSHAGATSSTTTTTAPPSRPELITRVVTVVRKLLYKHVHGVDVPTIGGKYVDAYGERLQTHSLRLGERSVTSFIASLPELYVNSSGSVTLNRNVKGGKKKPSAATTSTTSRSSSNGGKEKEEFPSRSVLVRRVLGLVEGLFEELGEGVDMPTIGGKYVEKYGARLQIHAQRLGEKNATTFMAAMPQLSINKRGNVFRCQKKSG